MSTADETPDKAPDEGLDRGATRPTPPGGRRDQPAAEIGDAPPAPERTVGIEQRRATRRSADRELTAASRDRFAFLAAASRCLAESLDYETTLATVAGMALPYLDAWCVVDVVTDGPEGTIRRLAVLHPDADKQAAARALYRDYPPHPDDLIGAARVIRTRRPELVFDVPDEALVGSARGPAHLALLRTLGIKAYVIVPMIARERVLGAITFITAEAGRRFGDVDVVMAEDLARRAAMAVDNARLHSEAVATRRAAEAALAVAEQATAALAASEARFRAVQENSPAGFALHLPVRAEDGRIVDFEYGYVNAAGAHLLGRAPADIVGQRLTAVDPDAAEAGLFSTYIRAAETGVPVEREILRRRDDHEAGLHVTIVPVGDALAVTFTDISERLAAEAFQREFASHLATWNVQLQESAAERERFLAESERARTALAEGAAERDRLLAAERAARAEADAARRDSEAANRAKGEFLATMSHELRTPLNAIGGYAELMEMGLRGPVTEQQLDDLGRIQRSQRHLLGLVNEVLNHAKLATGNVRYTVTDVPVREALAAAEALVAPQVRAKGLTLEVDDCAADLAVRADSEKLRQVLVNLLSNAIKFTDRGGAIAIVCEGRGDQVAIRVSDTGMGIPADKIDAIFEPFVQVRADLTRTAEGTGLGLSISRDLARGMGGDLTVKSEPGVGSTFTLTLPRANEARLDPHRAESR